MRKVVVIGAGPHAREIADALLARRAELEPDLEVVGFLEHPLRHRAGEEVAGLPVLGDLDWLESNGPGVEAVCAIGRPEVRVRVAEQARALGARFTNVVHPSAVVARRGRMGEGVVLGAGVVISDAVTLGDHAHVNLGCTVSHDVELGPCSYLAPGVHVAGRVVVGEGAYVGIGACTVQGVRIGRWSMVGAGAAVIHDVPDDAVVAGVPARLLRQREAGWHRE